VKEKEEDSEGIVEQRSRIQTEFQTWISCRRTHARTQLPASKKNALMIEYATELRIPPSTWRQATKHQQADDHRPACNWLGMSQELWKDLLGSFLFFLFFDPEELAISQT
jgi:hypothetical protein